jgi:hypothetical protein
MMFELAHTWPLSASTEVFLVTFIVLSVILALTGVLVAIIVGNVLDGPVQTTSLSSASPLSSAVVGSQSTLRPGQLPHGDEVFVTALLAGLVHLEAALCAAGAAAGWLRVSPDGQIKILADVVPDQPLLARCKEILDDPGAGRTPRHRLRTAALRLRPELMARAEALSMLRPVERRSGLILLSLGGVAVAGIVGGLRLFATEPFEEFRAIQCILSLEAGLVVVLAIWLTARHRQAWAWLTWLEDSIAALRADVRAGRDLRVDDIILVAAVDGFNLGATARRLGLNVFTR